MYRGPLWRLLRASSQQVCFRSSTLHTAATCKVTQRSFSASATDSSKWFQYNKALVRAVPDSFALGSVKAEEPTQPIDMGKVRTEHEKYVETLRALIPTVIELESEEQYPDSVFVEDPAVVVGGRALICRAGHPSRQGESVEIRNALQNVNIETFEILDDRATIEGGDVLFTGREFLVGLTSRTNQYGLEALARVFLEWPVTGVRINSEVLHLKSMCSMAGVDLIAMGDTPAGRRAWKDIEQNASFKYSKLFFPDNTAANCLFIKDTVCHTSKDDFPESYKVWDSLSISRISLCNTELRKADSALTCCSILIH